MFRSPKSPRVMTPLEMVNENREFERVLRLEANMTKVIRDYEAKFNSYVNGRRDHFRPPNIGFWSKFVGKFYDPNAVETWCFERCENSELFTKPRTDLIGNVSLCNICGSSSRNILKTTPKSMPLVFESLYETQLMSDVIELNETQEEFLPDDTFLFESHKSCRYMIYREFDIIFMGTIRIVYTKKQSQILSLRFCAETVKVSIPSDQIPPSLSFLYPTVYERNVLVSAEAFKHYATARKFNINYHIDSTCLPRLHRGCFLKVQMIETARMMKDLMNRTMKNQLGPIATYKLSGI
ncbi:hypothetical protein ABFS83_02G157100 [Erythranthe nasuta]